MPNGKLSELARIMATTTILAWAPAAAQVSTSPDWNGTVRDAAGAAAPKAELKLQGKGNRYSTVTADTGAFHFVAPAPGSYELSVTFAGHQFRLATPLTIPIDAKSRVTLLADGSIAIAQESQPQASGGETLTGKAVSSIPLNKRDFSQLLLLAAGTMTDTNGATNFTQQFAMNGQRGVEAVFAMDGADIERSRNGRRHPFQLQCRRRGGDPFGSGWMPADIGRGAAGFTNIVTRSGTNQIPRLCIRIPAQFRFRRAQLLRSQVPGESAAASRPSGATSSALRSAAPCSTARPISSSNIRASARCWAPRRCCPSPRPTSARESTPPPFRATLLRPRRPDGRRHSEPLSVAERSRRTVRRAHLRHLRRRSRPDADQFSVRLDHQLSPKDQLFARFSFDNLSGPTTNPDQTAIDPAFGVRYIDHQRNAVLTWARTASPTFSWESSLSFTRTTPSFPTADHTDPSLIFADGLYEAFNAAGGSVMAAFGNLFMGRQNFTWTRGQAHRSRSGAEFRANRDTTYFGIGSQRAVLFGGGAAYATGRHPLGRAAPTISRLATAVCPTR